MTRYTQPWVRDFPREEPYAFAFIAALTLVLVASAVISIVRVLA